MKTGLIAWRGMAGSVLLERMHKMKMGGEYPSAGCSASSRKIESTAFRNAGKRSLPGKGVENVYLSKAKETLKQKPPR